MFRAVQPDPGNLPSTLKIMGTRSEFSPGFLPGLCNSERHRRSRLRPGFVAGFGNIGSVRAEMVVMDERGSI